MSGADAIFEQLRSGGLPLLHQVVADGWQEDLLLDFKTLEKHSAPMSTNDRRNLAEALSGFANSDGGVIVWGINARANNPNDPDIAKQLCPISNIKLFYSELQRDTPHVVSPGIVGVEHYLVYESDSSETGFVITFVPKSETDIHMARAKDQFRFYYRSGSSFLLMEAFMVADRYGRRPRPKLELDYRLEHGGSSGRNIYVQLVIGIKNSGQGIALYPAVAIYESSTLKLDSYGLDGNGHTGLPERLRTSNRPEDARRLFVGGANDAIHPSTTLDVTCVRREIPLEVGDIPDLNIRCELYCQGYSASGEATVPMMYFFKKLRGF